MGSSVEAANLANNYSSDYGSVSLEDTKNILEENGIITCRGADNVAVADVNGIKVGLAGINFLNSEMKKELEEAIKKSKGDGRRDSYSLYPLGYREGRGA